MQDIENATLNPSGELYVKPVEYLSFENALTQFSSFEDGILSLAHPTVFYPMDSLKNSQKMPDLYEALHRDYVKFGKHKSRLVENLYQSYYQNSDMQVLEKIRNISAKYDLLSTGGLDTQGDSIFSV